MLRWKSRLAVLLAGFCAGLSLVLLYSLFADWFNFAPTVTSRGPTPLPCSGAAFFRAPEEILAALESPEVAVRRVAFRRLLLSPGVETTYFDFERDQSYPERSERGELRYVNLDEAGDQEALLTFVRWGRPAAVVLKQEACGWRSLATLGAWLKYEDYPYHGWLELHETVRPGTSEILLRESAGGTTHYTRRARLLKVSDGALRQIAEFDEEVIAPLPDYVAADWNSVRQRRLTRFTFHPTAIAAVAAPARVEIETSEEVIKYSSAATAPPAYLYWTEGDGAWHSARRHWRHSASSRVKLLAQDKRQLVWDQQRRAFVKVEESGGR